MNWKVEREHCFIDCKFCSKQLCSTKLAITESFLFTDNPYRYVCQWTQWGLKEVCNVIKLHGWLVWCHSLLNCYSTYLLSVVCQLKTCICVSFAVLLGILTKNLMMFGLSCQSSYHNALKLLHEHGKRFFNPFSINSLAM